MSDRRNPRAKWVLPEVVNPIETMCVQIQVPKERFHIAAFRGALLNLASATQWADDPDHTAKDVANVWKNVINGMTEVCEGLTGCRDVTPQAPLVTYEPQDPYTQPDFTPAGYLLPPFYMVTAGSIPNLLGFHVGDILTDITRIPVGTGVITEPTSGWARFRVNLHGTGIVTLQLLNVPLGGYALVTEDDDPLTAVFVELNLDLIDLPPENNFVVGNEHRFTTDGDHHIDVTFIPRFNDEAPAIFWGGGIRVITICGFEDMMFDIRQKDGSPCIIEKTNNGVDWIDAVDMTKCPVKVRSNLGIIQWYNPETDEWEDTGAGDERSDGTAPVPYPENPDGACLAAENITAVYQTTLTQIRAGVVASQAAVAIAATVTGIMGIFMSPAIVSTVALAIAGLALNLAESGLDTMLEESHLEDFKCVIRCNIQDDGSVLAGDFTAIRAEMAEKFSGLELELIEYYLDGYGSVGLQRQGTAGGVTTGDCDDCDCDECPFIDFTEANYTAILGTVGSGNGIDGGNALERTTGGSPDSIELEVGVTLTDCVPTQITLWVYIDWSSPYDRNLQFELRDNTETVLQSGTVAVQVPERGWYQRTIPVFVTLPTDTHLWLRTGAEGQAGLFKATDINFNEV